MKLKNYNPYISGPRKAFDDKMDHLTVSQSIAFSVRAELAWKLIEECAGNIRTPDEIVKGGFAIVDVFLAKAWKDGDIEILDNPFDGPKGE